jgi:transcriptional regulator of acetoin/glycerol metabolism
MSTMRSDVDQRRRAAEASRQALSRFAVDDLALSHAPLPGDISASWSRAAHAGVATSLTRAPIVLSPNDLAVHRRRLGWVGVAERCLVPQVHLVDEMKHVLTLFDADGVMVSSAGHHRTLQGLGDIHFFDGANWNEAEVGTNGPGTALSTGRPVHVIGAEHYCEALHVWHCAAAPVHDPDTRAVLGVVDISGFVEAASPTALMLAMSMAAVVDTELRLWVTERRAHVLQHYANIVARHPGDAAVAFDLRGRVVAATSPELAEQMPLVQLSSTWTGRFSSLPDGAVVMPIDDDSAHLGAVVLVPGRSRGVRVSLPHTLPPAARRRSSSTSSSSSSSSSSSGTRYSMHDVAGNTPAVRAAVRMATAAARNLLPVVVLGESGVGKEVLAQSIHAGSGRTGPFVAVNCGAIPATLVESELFGYVGGAFSGARREGGVGKFQAAEGGTLFLDEIGDLPLPAQTALLRALQEEEVTPVGGTTPQHVDVRIIAATHRDLPAEIAAGRFRADLFYRLNILSIELPPLRERVDDIEVLAERFLDEAVAETGRSARLGDGVAAALRAWPWPGNVRELKNLMRRLSAVGEGPWVLLDDLPAAMRAGAPAAVPQTSAATSTSSKAASRAPPTEAPNGSPTDDAAKRALVETIAAANTMSEAARTLGITRSHLYRQLQRYGLKPGRHTRED